MDKKSTCKLPIRPSSSSTLLSTGTPQTLQCTSSATGNPRNKCALKPGHSLMDWIRLGNSGVDLSGTGGRVISVSKEELMKHNKKNDAWIAIRGVVYNVTQYMEFHPGGVEELMRGVGSDATKLFDDTHAWVNYSQLLSKCRIGLLTTKLNFESGIEKSFVVPNNNPFAKPLTTSQQHDILPRLDWIQKSDNITIYFYTKLFCNPGLLIRNLFKKNCRIEFLILIDIHVHKFDIELQGHIKWPPKKVHISTESGKIEITLNKHEEHINLWRDLGDYKRTKMLATAPELDTLMEFKMLSNDKFNNDSFIMLLKNENVKYFPPVGYHFVFEDFVNGKRINKCYTPVPKRYTEIYVNFKMDMEYICFLIKYYSTVNSFSKYLLNMEKDATIKVSLPRGNLKLSNLASHRKFCFLAAGSGLTPFLSLIDHLLIRKTNRIESIKLLYFNKTITDIWCNEILSNMSSVDNRFEFVNILSCADKSWSGLKGRVSSELLLPIVNKSVENFSYVAACGPSNFITSVENILNELNFPNENLFIF